MQEVVAEAIIPPEDLEVPDGPVKTHPPAELEEMLLTEILRVAGYLWEGAEEEASKMIL